MKRLMMIGIVVGLAGWCLADATISDVTARQRYPWNGKVDISYTATGVVEKAKQEGLATTLKVSAVDLTTSTTNVATTLSGDMSLSDGTHKIVWDMNAQGLTFKSTNVVFNVSCETEPALYCIVDLSAGASATSYPVSYTNEIPGGSWSDEYKTTKLVLQRIEPGTCVVSVDKPYYVGVFEVTQKQYALVMGETPSYFSGDMRPVERVSYDKIRGSNQGAQYPNSTDVDSDSFMGKLRVHTGLYVDLPTEVQWEYACRAGTTTTYSYGDSADGAYMWYKSNAGSCTHEVGTRIANPWGLYDMHGNVWEWCLDGNSYSRVVRGGEWNDDANHCASAWRGGDCSWGRHWTFGFRIVRNAVFSDIGGSSSAIPIDLATGARVAASTEKITHSPVWESSAAENVACILVGGVEVFQSSETGTYEWTPTRNGTYALSHVVKNGDVTVGETLTAVFVVGGISPPMPVISPASGTTFEESLTISMSCAAKDTTIHYTTNGLTPTAESPTYTRKFRIFGKTTVKAIAFYEDGTTSEVAVAEYAKWRDDPVIRPKDGSVFQHSGQRVWIARKVKDGVVRYTTDGSEPTAESAVYVGPFAIDETTTVKAKVFGDQCFDSDVLTATLTREWVKLPTPVIAAAGAFTGTKNKVVLSCANGGATIRYTLNGSEPTAASPAYEKPFCVSGSCTVRAYAAQDDHLDSDVATLEIARAWGIGDTLGKPDHRFETGGDAGFVCVEDATAALGESMRSGEVKNSQTSVLSTVVVGPGTLAFKWKTSCEEDPPLHEWDHAEFAVDGEVVAVLDGETEWIEVTRRIEGDGEHAVTWAYVKDDVEAEGEDCLWVSEYAWATDYTETQTTEVPVPYGWLTAKCGDVVDEYDSYEKVAKQTALNGRLTVGQCYVAGVEPESATNDFRTVLEMVDGVPHVTWKPDKKSEREYKIWGSETIEGGGDWHWPTNALDRFFRVTVEMPQ